jgi:hypothetical protein
MRQAARDALILLSLGAALALWRVHIDPAYGVGEVFDSRFHLVWLIPLVITALCPWIFHPYFVAGRDLPQPRSRAPMRAASAPRIAPQSTDEAATRRRGAA